MVAFLVLGISNLAWMVIVSALVFLYKVAPLGIRLEYALALALVLAGICFTVGPSPVCAEVNSDAGMPNEEAGRCTYGLVRFRAITTSLIFGALPGFRGVGS
jgi:hypothetical protein